MSASLLTHTFKVNHIMNMLDEFTNGDGTVHYMFIGAHKPYENETQPTDPENSISYVSYDVFRNMIAGVLIGANDVVPMIRNIPWSEKVFAQYDDRTVDWMDQDFYCVVEELSAYHVFKCLSNSAGVRSTVMPLRSQIEPDDEFFMTADGYQWKYLYSIDEVDYRKFATPNFIPVFPNSEVTANAVDGAVESIEIVNPGAQLNSYAVGSIDDVAVGGNLQIMSITTDVNGQVLTFALESAIGSIVSGQGAQLKQGSTIVAVGVITSIAGMTASMQVNADQIGFDYVSGMTIVTNTGTAVTSSMSRAFVNSLSSNAGFYDGSAFYIRSGAGAGQIRTVSQYIIAGNQRRVVLDQPFDISPNLSSRFEIAPRAVIRGDGAGAEAIIGIDRYSNSISHVEIVRRGEGYTYADVVITANVGTTSAEDQIAQLRAVISPPGGHGSNVYSELCASNLGIGIRMSDVGIEQTNEFRTVGMIRNPLFKNVVLTIDVSGVSFQANETVRQANGAKGTIAARIGNTITVDMASGVFSAGQPVTGDSSLMTANVTAVDTDMRFFDQTTKMLVDVVYDGPNGSGFLQDEAVLQTSSGSNATGRIFSIETGIITLTDVRGNFTVSDEPSGVVETFVGQTSGAVAKINGLKQGQLEPYKGQVEYIEHVVPVALSEDQDEIVKLVVKV